MTHSNITLTHVSYTSFPILFSFLDSNLSAQNKSMYKLKKKKTNFLEPLILMAFFSFFFFFWCSRVQGQSISLTSFTKDLTQEKIKPIFCCNKTLSYGFIISADKIGVLKMLCKITKG